MLSCFVVLKPIFTFFIFQGKRLVFVTNNSTKSRKQYGKKFETLGLDVSEVSSWPILNSQIVYVIVHNLKTTPCIRKKFLHHLLPLQHIWSPLISRQIRRYANQEFITSKLVMNWKLKANLSVRLKTSAEGQAFPPSTQT